MYTFVVCNMYVCICVCVFNGDFWANTTRMCEIWKYEIWKYDVFVVVVISYYTNGYIDNERERVIKRVVDRMCVIACMSMTIKGNWCKHDVMVRVRHIVNGPISELICLSVADIAYDIYVYMSNQTLCAWLCTISPLNSVRSTERTYESTKKQATRFEKNQHKNRRYADIQMVA